ncbi:hypothetical protein HN784_00670 [bacterium]|jgi:hypothetical protein|nr:hypothetical protein [bacterium]MBT4251592.1 hypothetical protein [bacterium]MBT4597641.1 hypothetical protein [bacterium]MBT6753654.1 hypothetical protein [bacterium]MBT7037791.1 hypothetical protein [bacterium]
MDILNIILIALIFVSLIVIIGIFGRNLKKFKQAGKSAELRREIRKRDKKERKFSFSFLFSKLSEFFVWFAEAIVSNAKKALQNAHSGLMEIKAKKKSKNEPIVDELPSTATIKSKKNIFKNRPVASKEVFSKSTDKKKAKDTTTKKSKLDNLHKLTEQKVVKKDAVGNGEKNKKKEVSAEKGFFSKINPFKKKEVIQEKGFFSEESFNDFSDGVTKIDPKTAKQNQFDSSMKSIVRPKKVSRENIIEDDDELGVDRKILEKKILQKIATNPKDIEGYRQLGELYIKMDNFDDAQSAYRFILKVSARDVDASRKLEKIKLLKRLK